MTSRRTQEIRTGLARLHAADPVLARVIGPWTGQGALLIALRRPDLVRTDDLARRWSPYRSLASSLLLAAARSS